MTVKYRRGFATTVLLLAAAGWVACSSSDSTGTDSTPPVLSVPMIDLALLTDFLPFGADLGGHTSPTYELYTSLDTVTVHAVTAGIVERIFHNEAPNTDYEILIRLTNQSIYRIDYDHVRSVQVSVGQAVTAGQAIGQIGPFSDAGGHRNGRVELQINRGNDAGTLAFCPRDFGTAEFNAAYAAAFSRFPVRGTSICIVDTVTP